MSKFSKEQKEEILRRIRRKAEEDLSSCPSSEKKSASLEERKTHWLMRIFSLIRRSEETSGHYVHLFSRGNYQAWKEEEPQIDEILDYVIDVIDKEFGAGGEMNKKINEALGIKK